MSFPVSPTNGQQSTIANIVYEYASATNSWTVVPGYANSITATGNIAASYFLGNGSQLTGLPALYGNSDVAAYLASGTNSSNINITGNIFTGNILTNGYYYANGVAFSGGGGGTPGGANTQIQFNNSGLFSGSAGFTFDVTSNAVIATGNVSGGNLIQSGTRVIKWTTVANTAPSNAVQGDFWYDSYASKKYQYTNDGAGNTWVDQSSPTTFTTLTTNQILNGGSSGTGNIGASGATFNTVFAKATSAQYADLAEKYVSDKDYLPGTVVVFGGEKEITVSTQSHDTRVAGVISTDPAFIMNSESTGLPVALTGRVPCFVKGPVSKGDLIVTSDITGVAQRLTNWQPGCVIGKSLENIENDLVQTIEVVIGRF